MCAWCGKKHLTSKECGAVQKSNSEAICAFLLLLCFFSFYMLLEERSVKSLRFLVLLKIDRQWHSGCFFTSGMRKAVPPVASFTSLYSPTSDWHILVNGIQNPLVAVCVCDVKARHLTPALGYHHHCLREKAAKKAPILETCDTDRKTQLCCQILIVCFFVVNTVKST